MKPTQTTLFVVPRVDSPSIAEIVRRGGPREVMMIRQRGQKANRKAQEAPQGPISPEVLNAMGWRKKGL